MPTTTANPFLRGALSLSAQRVLMISFDTQQPPCYRPLHPSQLLFADEAMTQQPCRFNNDWCWCNTLQDTELARAETQQEGQIIAVIYELLMEANGKWVHLADVPTAAAAKTALDLLRFETGHYSRSWEISSTHVPEAEYCDYCLPASYELKTRYFECFALSSNQSVGFKLYDTPWAAVGAEHGSQPDHHPIASDLQADGVPDTLISLLILAGEADVRFLVLDPDAPVLPGLPSF